MRPSVSPCNSSSREEELSSSFDRFLSSTSSSGNSKDEGCAPRTVDAHAEGGGRESPCGSLASTRSITTTASTSTNSSTTTAMYDNKNTTTKRPNPVQLQIVSNAPPQAASAAVIRSRFLLTLGIANDEIRRAQREASLQKNQIVSPRTLQRKRSPSFQEALKGDYGQPTEATADQDDLLSTSAPPSLLSLKHSSSWLSRSFSSHSLRGSSTLLNNSDRSLSSHNSGSSASLAVSFDAAVTVHPIPNRAAYSERIKNQLWQSPDEMQENAARNCFEFASEGWDWQRVAGDDEMIVRGGERIHPIHFLCYQQQS